MGRIYNKEGGKGKPHHFKKDKGRSLRKGPRGPKLRKGEMLLRLPGGRVALYPDEPLASRRRRR